MIELIVLRHLEQKLPEPVYMEFPSNPPDRFFVLKKADSGREDLIDSAMFTLQSYGESLLEAAKLNELAKAAMDSLMELDEIADSRRGGDYPFPDTKNKRYRYQTVHNITHY